jgi:hypothetical protein
LGVTNRQQRLFEKLFKRLEAPRSFQVGAEVSQYILIVLQRCVLGSERPIVNGSRVERRGKRDGYHDGESSSHRSFAFQCVAFFVPFFPVYGFTFPFVL